MKTILFDLDGTLSDSKPGILASLEYALSCLGLSLDPSLPADQLIGPPLHLILGKLLGPAKADLVPEALRLYRERYKAKGLYETSLYPGMHESLGRLAGKSRIYVATSKPHLFATEVVNHLGIIEYFEKIYGSELDGSRSGKGELIGHLCSVEGLDPKSAFMVGDREHDMIGATKNNMKGLGAGWGYGSREELLQSGALSVFGSPGALTDYLLPLL